MPMRWSSREMPDYHDAGVHDQDDGSLVVRDEVDNDAEEGDASKASYAKDDPS
jgi:hypothetical protein